MKASSFCSILNRIFKSICNCSNIEKSEYGRQQGFTEVRPPQLLRAVLGTRRALAVGYVRELLPFAILTLRTDVNRHEQRSVGITRRQANTAVRDHSRLRQGLARGGLGCRAGDAPALASARPAAKEFQLCQWAWPGPSYSRSTFALRYLVRSVSTSKVTASSGNRMATELPSGRPSEFRHGLPPSLSAPCKVVSYMAWKATIPVTYLHNDLKWQCARQC